MGGAETRDWYVYSLLIEKTKHPPIPETEGKTVGPTPGQMYNQTVQLMSRYVCPLKQVGTKKNEYSHRLR